MSTEREQVGADQKQPMDISGGSPAEFAAVITVLIFIVCSAAALLLATPPAFEAAASPPAGTAVRIDREVTDRPFHERYPVNAVGEPVDPPTF